MLMRSLEDKLGWKEKGGRFKELPSMILQSQQHLNRLGCLNLRSATLHSMRARLPYSAMCKSCPCISTVCEAEEPVILTPIISFRRVCEKGGTLVDISTWGKAYLHW